VPVYQTTIATCHIDAGVSLVGRDTQSRSSQLDSRRLIQDSRARKRTATGRKDSIMSSPNKALEAADHQPDRPAGSRELHLPKIISFESLVRCGDEVWIENEGQIYRLRRTRQGKLILTK
jgi:hemin uptake protein HemP